MHNGLSVFIIPILLFSEVFGQTETSYIPVTINSPLFAKNIEKEFQAGSLINNYGLNFHFNGHFKNKIIIFSVQQNNGYIKFDPLNFNKYYSQGQESHLIQSYPTKMLYGELGFGYNFKLYSQKLSLITGFGQQFQNKNTRYFIQLDWGNESKLINAGVSLRGNYTLVKNNEFFTLEPVIQGKVRIWKLRIVNQFGYSIAIKKKHDYLKPILTVGLELII